MKMTVRPLLSFTGRLMRNGLLYRPTSTKPVLNGGRVDACSSRPLGNRKRQSIKGDESRILVDALVLTLLKGCRPLAVLRRVVTIVVNPINGQTVRLQPHILHKVIDNTPAATYLDAPATVVSIAYVLRIAASLVHVAKTVVGGCLRQAMSVGRVVGSRAVNEPACGNISCSHCAISLAFWSGGWGLPSPSTDTIA